MKVTGMAAFLLVSMAFFAMAQSVFAEPDSQLVCADKDQHGCIGSAGYTWSNEKQKCLRPWEEECNDCFQETGSDGTGLAEEGQNGLLGASPALYAAENGNETQPLGEPKQVMAQASNENTLLQGPISWLQGILQAILSMFGL